MSWFEQDKRNAGRLFAEAFLEYHIMWYIGTGAFTCELSLMEDGAIKIVRFHRRGADSETVTAQNFPKRMEELAVIYYDQLGLHSIKEGQEKVGIGFFENWKNLNRCSMER